MQTTAFLHRILGRLQREEGFALVLALGVVVVLGIVGTTVMVYASHNSTLSSRSSADQRAFALAEAGVNNAMSVLSNPSNNALSSLLLPSSLATANVNAYDGGYVKWWGMLSASNSTWTLSAWGYARNPTGATASEVIRKISTTVKVRPSLMQPLNNPAWNYIMALRTGTPGGCDLSLGNSVDIQSSLFVQGNLCLQTPSSISQGAEPTLLVVKGSTTLQVNTNIGASAKPISEAHVAGGCTYKNNPGHSPCGSADQVFASISDSTPTAITAPAADFAGWYANAAPGPNTACTTKSGTVPVFDNNGVRDNSVPGVFNLTPSSSDYSCIVSIGGKTVGQLSWDHNTKMLTTYGTIYIDGSACACYGFSNVPIQYNGQATLYLSGTFQIKDTKLCGGISGSSCDFNAWDPNKEMLIVVADGQGGQNPSGDGAQLVSAYFQGGLFTTYAIELDTSSNTEGPMIASTEIIGQTVTAHNWPLITSIPDGAPGQPTIYAQPDPPGNFVG